MEPDSLAYYKPRKEQEGANQKPGKPSDAFEKSGTILAYECYRFKKLETWERAARQLLDLSTTELEGKVEESKAQGSVLEQMRFMSNSRAEQINRLLDDKNATTKDLRYEWTCASVDEKKVNNKRGTYDVPSMDVIIGKVVKKQNTIAIGPVIPGEFIDLKERADPKFIKTASSWWDEGLETIRKPNHSDPKSHLIPRAVLKDQSDGPPGPLSTLFDDEFPGYETDWDDELQPTRPPKRRHGHNRAMRPSNTWNDEDVRRQPAIESVESNDEEFDQVNREVTVSEVDRILINHLEPNHPDIAALFSERALESGRPSQDDLVLINHLEPIRPDITALAMERALESEPDSDIEAVALTASSTITDQEISHTTSFLAKVSKDDDAVSEPDSLDDASSIFSIDTDVSSNSSVSSTEIDIAGQQLLVILASKDDIRNLCSIACELQDLTADAFETRVRRLLKLMSIRLKEEAKSEPERATSYLASRRARAIAYEFRKTYFDSGDESVNDLRDGPSFAKRQLLERWLREKANSLRDRSQNTESGDDSDLDDEPIGPELPSLNNLIGFLSTSTAVAEFSASLRRFVLNAMWEPIDLIWKTQTATRFPLGFQRLGDGDLLISSGEKVPIFDHLKLMLERYSGQPWNWWPLHEPSGLLREGQSRVHWRCKCGIWLHADVSTELAEAISMRHSLTRAISARPLEEAEGKETPSEPSSTTSKDPMGVEHPEQSNRMTSTGGKEPHRAKKDKKSVRPSGTEPNRHHQSASNLFVLLCVPTGASLKHSIVELSTYSTDETFFPEIRKQCRRLRGFLRHYFSLYTFQFCHASKFERWTVDQLAKRLNEMPPESERDYIYRPTPREVPYLVPLSVHEWACRMSGRVNATPKACNNFSSCADEALMLLPKRRRFFQINTHMKREFMWGLCAEYRIAFMRFVLWHFAIASIGLGFMVFWLETHRGGDWQDAEVPISLILAAMTVLWLPLSERFREGVVV